MSGSSDSASEKLAKSWMRLRSKFMVCWSAKKMSEPVMPNSAVASFTFCFGSKVVRQTLRTDSADTKWPLEFLKKEMLKGLIKTSQQFRDGH